MDETARSAETEEHPAFTRAKKLHEPLRSHFPKSTEECSGWKPLIRRRALASRVMVVAQTRIVCAWSAYIDAVPGQNHDHEWQNVLAEGAKLDERLARLLFTEFDQVPYAH